MSFELHYPIQNSKLMIHNSMLASSAAHEDRATAEATAAEAATSASCRAAGGSIDYEGVAFAKRRVADDFGGSRITQAGLHGYADLLAVRLQHVHDLLPAFGAYCAIGHGQH